MEETKFSPIFQPINQEKYLKILNDIIQDKNLLQIIFDSLNPEDLMKIAPVCQIWKGASSEDRLWEPIVREELPEKFQKLACEILKDKFVAYLNDGKERIDLVLKHADTQVEIFKGIYVNLFSRELVNFLKVPTKTKKEKIHALDAELNIARIFNILPSHPIKLHLLQHLCLNKKTEAIEILLKAGANPNLINNGVTPFMNAVATKDFELIKLLLEYGGNPKLENSKGKSALDYIYDPAFGAWDENSRMIEKLLLGS